MQYPTAHWLQGEVCHGSQESGGIADSHLREVTLVAITRRAFPTTTPLVMGTEKFPARDPAVHAGYSEAPYAEEYPSGLHIPTSKMEQRYREKYKVSFINKIRNIAALLMRLVIVALH